MVRTFLCRGSALAAILTLAGSLHAEQPSVNLRGFTPPPGPKGGLYLESVNTPGPWQFNLAGWASWAYRPLVVRREGAIVGEVVKQQGSLDLGGAVGIGKRFELGLVLPVVVAQSSEENAETSRILEGSAVPSQALGDATLALKAALKSFDDAPDSLGGYGLALVGRVTAPTGSRASTVGEGQITTEARLLGELLLPLPVSVPLASRASLRATAGFKVRPEEHTFGGKTWGNEIPWGAGLGFRLKTSQPGKTSPWLLGIEAHGALPAGPDAPFTSKAQSPAYLGAMARYTARDLSLLAGLETGLTQAAGSTPLRAVLGLNWAPRDHDMDKDGVEDDKDDCKQIAEDRDGFEDNDGCPEPDNDNDNVMDVDDKCPVEAEDEDEFEDDDGCPDPDNDKDGIPDDKDRCPDDAGPASPDPKRNGCPMRDSDDDGVLGDADKCPVEAEDKDGFEDDDGCPDPDNDGDGVADVDDRCPGQKGEASVSPEQNGCPSADRDLDGIANEADKCPDKAETYNGKDDDDGCPEPQGKEKPLVELVDRKGVKQVTSAPLRFAKGSAELQPGSRAAARALGLLLATTPGLKLVVAVRPSPADGGDDLARARAAALADALVRASRRPDAASAGAWEKGKMPPSAEVTGVALIPALTQGKAP